MKKKTVIIAVVIAALIAAAGLSVLIWWLVTRNTDYETIRLEGDGIGDLPYTAALTRINNVGDIFWWFYPTSASDPQRKPIILWLSGVLGTAPSLLANLGMFGPYDIYLNPRTNSWVDRYNLLFIDNLGTGFSSIAESGRTPSTTEEHADYLSLALNSFYDEHKEYKEAPLYIFGHADGAHLAVALTIKLNENRIFSHNLQGVALGNGIVSPALAMTKLGFYLEELGYIEANGRSAIEELSSDINDLVIQGEYDSAFDSFVSLNDFINENAGAVAVNVGYIVEKLTRHSTQRDYFGQTKYMQEVLNLRDSGFMTTVVAPALGIPSGVSYDANRDDVIDGLKSTFMNPIVVKVEYILQNTEVSVSIYNGNLDAVSNTPGQLEWVNYLQWSGQDEFLSSPRETIVANRLVEGYFRETQRLKFYWINVAGQSVPVDNPAAMNVFLRRTVV